METKPALVYGLWRDECFVVFKDAWAVAAGEEMKAWQAVRTVREARELLARCVHLPEPVTVEELDEFVEDHAGDQDCEWSLDSANDVQDQEWPPMPGAVGYNDLPPEWGLGEIMQTWSDDDYVSIDPADERTMLALAKLSGYQIRRDDALINLLDNN